MNDNIFLFFSNYYIILIFVLNISKNKDNFPKLMIFMIYLFLIFNFS